jgi:hypothetical protein
MHAFKALGELISNLLALFGFRPVDSLVLVGTVGSEVCCGIRIDLGDAAHGDELAQLADLVARGGADAVVAVFVSAERADCVLSVQQFGQQARALAAAMQRRGLELVGAVVVDRIEAGGRWRCVDDCGRTGVLVDPASRAAVMEAVVAGRRIYGSREELSAMVAPDVERAATLAPLLAGAPDRVEDVAVAVRAAVAMVRRVGLGAVLSDVELGVIGAMLVDVRVRDALMTLVDCQEAAAAEQLWLQLARVLPHPFRSEALALTAYSAYVRGEGPLAGVCLKAVQAEDPSHYFTKLLNAALLTGLPPEAIRSLTSRLTPAVLV